VNPIRERFFWLAIVIALGVTVLFWRRVQLYKPPPPLTNVSVLTGAVGHLVTGGHGCPASLSETSMECSLDPLRLRMTFICRTTGESLATRDVKDLWPKRQDFIVLRECGDASVILWKPARVAFGVRSLTIELMSRDPDRIIQLMCGESANATPAPGGSPRAGAAVTREDSPTPTGSPAARPR